MPHAFVLDEHLRGPLWEAILRHNLHADGSLDVVCVGEAVDLPLGIDDAGILRWAEREQRILATEDRSTMPAHLQEHLESGRHSPGILMVRRGASVRDLLEILLLVSQAGRAAEFADAITYVP